MDPFHGPFSFSLTQGRVSIALKSLFFLGGLEYRYQLKVRRFHYGCFRWRFAVHKNNGLQRAELLDRTEGPGFH